MTKFFKLLFGNSVDSILKSLTKNIRALEALIEAKEAEIKTAREEAELAMTRASAADAEKKRATKVVGKLNTLIGLDAE